MIYNEFIGETGKAGLYIREFTDLLAMRPNSVSDIVKRGKVPSHLTIIADILVGMHIQGIPLGIPLGPIFFYLDLTKKKSRGSASSCKFGGGKQQQ